MKTSILTFLAIGLLSSIIVISSCTSNTTSDKKVSSENNSSIAKKWTLSDNNGNSTQNNPTMVVMSLEKNGYFIIYDTITDPKFVAAGINKIQPISKGQWKYNDNELTLNHLIPDSSVVEVFKVQMITDSKLVTIDSHNKKHTYKIR